MEHTGFWSRVAQKFKRTGGSEIDSKPPPETPSVLGSPAAKDPTPQPTHRTDSTLPASEGFPIPAASEPTKLDSKLRFAKSGTLSQSADRLGIERLADEYARIVKLMDAIQAHMAGQEQRSEQMVRSLDQLASGQAQAPEAQRQQVELLSSIREAVAAEAAGSKRIEDQLAQWPGIADAQRETMVSISHQLDSTRETNERVGSALTEVHAATTGLSAATESSTKLVFQLRSDALAREQRLAELLEFQTKRLSTIAWTAIALGGVVAIASVTALFM